MGEKKKSKIKKQKVGKKNEVILKSTTRNKIYYLKENCQYKYVSK